MRCYYSCTLGWHLREVSMRVCWGWEWDDGEGEDLVVLLMPVI
jgi:hypothetical protein